MCVMTTHAESTAKQKGNTMNTFATAISGMTGPVCVTKVLHALTGVLGVLGADVKVGSAVVTFDPAATNETQLRTAIRKLGFVPAGA
jgi:copper chaperone CopZ